MPTSFGSAGTTSNWIFSIRKPPLTHDSLIFRKIWLPARYVLRRWLFADAHRLQGQLLEAQAREAAELARADHLQDTLNATGTQTHDAQEAFNTTHSAAQEKVAELTTTLDARTATLATSQALGLELQSQRSAAAGRISQAKARIAAATLKRERLSAERAERERVRKAESTLR